MGVHRQSKTSQATGSKPRIVKGHPDFAQYLKGLRSSHSKQDKYLLALIDDSIKLIEQGRILGHSVPRDRWPKEYRRPLEPIPCLFTVELDDNYRLEYSLIRKPDEPLFAWIIEVMDHNEYNKRFGYY